MATWLPSRRRHFVLLVGTNTLYRPLCTVENLEIRLHRTVLYTSIYRGDDQLMVNQHTYGIPAAQAPVFCLRDAVGGEMAALYLDSFELVWASSALLA